MYETDYSGGENGYEEKEFAFNDKSIRRGFIRKVYFILFCQLLVTISIISVFVFYEKANIFVYNHPTIIFVALGVLLVSIIALSCCGELRRKTPTNYIFLFLFTIAESFFLGVASAQYDPDVVFMAAGITAIVCLSLTIFAFQTKWDFTLLGGILFVALIILLVFGIAAFFIKTKLVLLIYCSLGVLIFSFYLVYDTQLMLGGSHKYSISPEEYVFAALNLYLDIIYIFIFILRIIGYAR